MLRSARPLRNYMMFCEGKWCLCSLCFRLFDSVDALAMHQRDSHKSGKYEQLDALKVSVN